MKCRSRYLSIRLESSQGACGKLYAVPTLSPPGSGCLGAGVLLRPLSRGSLRSLMRLDDPSLGSSESALWRRELATRGSTQEHCTVSLQKAIVYGRLEIFMYSSPRCKKHSYVEALSSQPALDYLPFQGSENAVKNLVLSMVGLTLCVACTSGASVSEGAAKGAPLTQPVSTSPVPEEPAASMVPQPALSTESAAAVDGPSAETFLATLCEKRDFEAVRFYDGTSDEVSLTPKLALCRAEAFLTVDRLELAREAVAPMLLRADPMAYRARALLSDYYERLGRFDSIVELYTSTHIGDDP